MWIVFLLKYIREKMRKKSMLGVLLHSKHFKMLSKSRRQLYSYTHRINGQWFSEELSRSPHCVRCSLFALGEREQNLPGGDYLLWEIKPCSQDKC